MIKVNKHEVLREWISKFFEFGEWLFFENVEMTPNACSLVPNYGDNIVYENICGDKRKEYSFAFVGVKSFDTGTSTQNTDNMLYFDEFQDWLNNQEKNKDYPDFGTNCSEYKIIPLQNMANMAFYDSDNGVAKYMFMCRISYLEKEN